MNNPTFFSKFFHRTCDSIWHTLPFHYSLSHEIPEAYLADFKYLHYFDDIIFPSFMPQEWGHDVIDGWEFMHDYFDYHHQQWLCMSECFSSSEIAFSTSVCMVVCSCGTWLMTSWKSGLTSVLMHSILEIPKSLCFLHRFYDRSDTFYPCMSCELRGYVLERSL